MSPQKSAGWHVQRLARCVTSSHSSLSKNGCDDKINSTHCAPRFANPNAMLAILLSVCLHFEGKAAFGVRKAAAKWFLAFDLPTTGD